MQGKQILPEGQFWDINVQLLPEIHKVTKRTWSFLSCFTTKTKRKLACKCNTML